MAKLIHVSPVPNIEFDSFQHSNPGTHSDTPLFKNVLYCMSDIEGAEYNASFYRDRGLLAVGDPYYVYTIEYPDQHIIDANAPTLQKQYWQHIKKHIRFDKRLFERPKRWYKWLDDESMNLNSVELKQIVLDSGIPAVKNFNRFGNSEYHYGVVTLIFDLTKIVSVTSETRFLR